MTATTASAADIATTTTPTTPAAAAVTAIRRHRVVAVVRHHDADVASQIATACIDGGLALIEITFTTPDASSIIADLCSRAPVGVHIGAGTVLRPEQVTAAVASGATFLVSPTTDPETITAGIASGAAFIPGAATPSEVFLGVRHGAAMVKLFPAGGLGRPFLKAVAAVLPDVPLLPSGGIGVADVPGWLDAGAAAVAIGSELNAAHAAGGADAVRDLAATAAANSTTQLPTQTRTTQS